MSAPGEVVTDDLPQRLLMEANLLVTVFGRANEASDVSLMREAAAALQARLVIPDATDAQIAEWLERHDLAHAIRGTDARAAYEDAQSGHMAAASVAARPKFMEGDRVRYTNIEGGGAMATVRRAETRWHRDGTPYVFYMLRFDDGTDSRGIPQSAVKAPGAIDDRSSGRS